TAQQSVRTGQIEIDPYLGEIERIRYHAKSGTVDLRYQIVNHIVFQGPVESPLVRQMIRHALTEEDPSTRLYAAKVLQAIAQKEQNLDVELLGTLEQVLRKESNPGVRLMAVRALQSVPINEAIRNALTRVLLYDRNPALRIQAFDSLTEPLEPIETQEPLLRSVQADTSSYIRHRANDLLKKIEVEKSRALLTSREG
ncbi:HEAT repeat domain-containing protein, partial [bacterium]|nr:HEAT repeat domain-containing protein [bacterium]